MSTTQAPGSERTDPETSRGDLLAGFVLLLGCQLGGEALSRVLRLPIPGPVLGMALLALGLVLAGRVPRGLARAGHGLLGHLSIFFVPAGVGIVTLLPLLRREALPILVALVASTLLGLAATALAMKGISILLARRPR